MKQEPITEVVPRRDRRSQFEIPTELDDLEAKERASTLYRLALRAEARGQVDTAIESLTQAIDFYDSATYLNRLGLLHARRGDLERAAAFVGRASRAAPDNVAYRANLEKISALIRKSPTQRIDRDASAF